MLKKMFRNTEGGKVGAIDGLNLFFGALLGANLGTMQALAIGEYVKLVILLAGTVMVLRMISTSERRGYVLAVLGIYALLIGGMPFLPTLQPKGSPPPTSTAWSRLWASGCYLCSAPSCHQCTFRKIPSGGEDPARGSTQRIRAS